MGGDWFSENVTVANGVSGACWRWKDEEEVESRMKPFVIKVNHPPGAFSVLDVDITHCNVRIFEHPPPKFSPQYDRLKFHIHTQQTD